MRVSIAYPAALALALLLPVRPVEAQAPLGFGAGYVINAPQQMAGVGVHLLIPGLYGFGLYLDAKFDPLSDTRDGVLLPGVTHHEAENVFFDEYFRDESRWQSFNAALLYSVTEELRLYAGAGLTHRDAFTEYWDETHQRGELGYYWIEDPANTGNRVNVLGGAFLRMGRGVYTQFGVESAPRGFTLGLTLSFPRI